MAFTTEHFFTKLESTFQYPPPRFGGCSKHDPATKVENYAEHFFIVSDMIYEDNRE